MISIEKLRSLRHGIFHASCPDGISSALVLKDAIPDLRVSFVKYGTEEHKNFPAEPGQIWCDFSPPKERAAEFVAAGALVLDHHSRDVVEPYGELGVFGENEKLQCGAWLAYEHVWKAIRLGHGPFNPPDHLQEQVRDFALRAAVRDTWQRDDERFKRAREEGELLLFWGMKQPLDYYLGLSDEGRGVLAGRLFERAEELARKCIAESHRFTTKRGTRVLMFQGVSATSDAAELLEKDWNEAGGDQTFKAMPDYFGKQQPDLVVGFHYRVDGGKLVLQFSTRSHTGFDCQALARAHGGNGHKAAAGFTIDQSAEVGSNAYAVFRLLLEEWEGGQ